MADTDESGPETRVAKIERVFRTDYGNGPEQDVAEILTDLRHYCDAHGLDYGERDRAAYDFYLAEAHGRAACRPSGPSRREPAMKLRELSKDGALDMLERICSALWLPGREDAPWSADTLQNVAAVFGDYGLDSENVAPQGPEPEPIQCPACSSREFVRVVGGIEIVTECRFDEARRQIRLRFDREEQREPHDGADYYRRYCCGKCDAELPQEIMDRINDDEYEEVDADDA